jgi:hypothetical protein
VARRLVLVFEAAAILYVAVTNGDNGDDAAPASK